MLIVNVTIHATVLSEDDDIVSKLAPDGVSERVKYIEDRMPNRVRHIFLAMDGEYFAEQCSQARNLDTSVDPVEITVDHHLAGLARITQRIIPCYW